MTASLKFRPGFRAVWSRPDSPPPAVCSCCSGGLPEVPLMMWAADGSAISLCDGCVERWLTTGEQP